MTPGLTLPAALADQMLAHARAELPNEACGLLAGDATSGVARVFHPARNARASTLRYDLHPEDLVRIVFVIERDGDELVAVFHSHPNSPAVPSATDAREARYPVLQLLATLEDRATTAASALRAWRLGPGGASELPLHIV